MREVNTYLIGVVHVHVQFYMLDERRKKKTNNSKWTEKNKQFRTTRFTSNKPYVVITTNDSYFFLHFSPPDFNGTDSIFEVTL